MGQRHWLFSHEKMGHPPPEEKHRPIQPPPLHTWWGLLVEGVGDVHVPRGGLRAGHRGTQHALQAPLCRPRPAPAPSALGGGPSVGHRAVGGLRSHTPHPPRLSIPSATAVRWGNPSLNCLPNPKRAASEPPDLKLQPISRDNRSEDGWAGWGRGVGAQPRIFIPTTRSSGAAEEAGAGAEGGGGDRGGHTRRCRGQ